MRSSTIKYITLSWAVVGIFEQDSGFSLASLQKDKETMEEAVEQYVIGYMAFWHIAFVEKKQMLVCTDAVTIRKGKEKIERYIETHPPVVPLPKFYLVFLNQSQISSDADGLSDVFCL
ncbi:MAG: hypothetical protein J6C87_04045 [Bacteroides sp.]|nr:hypothetical protein [Bacteroides sp.]